MITKIMNAEHEASRLFIKELSKKLTAEIYLNTFFFLITIPAAAVAAAAAQLKILLLWRLPFLKDFLNLQNFFILEF